MTAPLKIFTTDNPFGPGVPDAASLARQAAMWDASEAVDMVLLGYSALWPHNFVTAPYIYATTRRVGLIVAHRPGVMHPVPAARAFGTMDFLSGGGRLAVNLVSGSSDKDLHREGDYLPKAERYARAADYVACMERCWSEATSFDYAGPYYQAAGVRQLMKPPGGHVPIYMGGESDDAIDFGAHYADFYMLWGEPLAGTRERIERVRAAAAKYDRVPQFSLSLRLFLGDTDDEAWAGARAAEDAILAAQGTTRFIRSSTTDQSVGRARQLALTDTEVHDECFWTALTQLLGGYANSAALVGTPDRIMAALKNYRALGIDAFLITTGVDGFWDPALEEFMRQVKREL